MQRGLVLLEPRARLGAIEPAFDPADHPPVAVGEVVPALPDIRLDAEPVVVKVSGDLGPGIARIERTEDFLRRADIVRLDELDGLGELGIVVTTPDVRRLTANEAAGRFRIGPVGMLDELTNQVRPDRVLVRQTIQKRREIEVGRGAYPVVPE